jgi:hypothetical protein
MSSNETVAVSFGNQIKPLFRTKDITAMKNVGGFDLSKYGDVKADAENILARLRDGSMPCDGAWTAENVRLFADWIVGGCAP